MGSLFGPPPTSPLSTILGPYAPDLPPQGWLAELLSRYPSASMASNPLAVILGSQTFDMPSQNSLGALLSSHRRQSPPPSPLATLLSTTHAPGLPPQGSLAALLSHLPTEPTPPSPLAKLLRAYEADDAKKRKAFFSFHFDDVMRVNVVRKAWQIDHPDSALMRSFYDSSLWEERQMEGPESLQQLIRDGVKHTSAICVLAGTNTWSRRWVRYEIARAVIDKRGLLAVHINSINHHVRRIPDPLGPNPLDQLAVGKVQGLLSIPLYYLFEYTAGGWVRYQDHTAAVDLPAYLQDPAPGQLMQLSTGTLVYDYVVHEGHKNIGTWIDQAAQAVGR